MLGFGRESAYGFAVGKVTTGPPNEPKVTKLAIFTYEELTQDPISMYKFLTMLHGPEDPYDNLL